MNTNNGNVILADCEVKALNNLNRALDMGLQEGKLASAASISTLVTEALKRGWKSSDFHHEGISMATICRAMYRITENKEIGILLDPFKILRNIAIQE
ncbi:MAG: hypothetical protein WC905_02105 [Patescibacteria group bacterium]|jgi:hypothetical protein